MTAPSRRRLTLDNAHATITAALTSRHDLRPALSDLDRTLPRFDDAVHRMMDARPGLPGAATYDGPRGGTSELTGPERLASTPDRTAGARATLDRSLRQLGWDCDHLTATAPASWPVARMCATTGTLWRLTVAWTPRPPTDRQRREVEHSNAAPECKITRDNLGIFEAVYRTSNLGGLLPEPEPVGRWVYDQARKLGRLPTPNELRRWASTDDDARKRMIGSTAGR